MATPLRFAFWIRVAQTKLKSARKWVPQVSRHTGASGHRSSSLGWFRPRKATNSTRTSGAPSLRRFLPKGWENTLLKSAQAALVAIAICISTAATDAGQRFNNVGHRLMCTCGCAQLLGECNHVGCPESGRMRDELSAAIASGATDKQILSSFAAKYGATVLAAPPTEGFSLVAWIAPIAVFAAALLGTILLVRHWSVGSTFAPAQSADPAMKVLREKIRRETEASDL